jgi:hypothetical protein
MHDTRALRFACETGQICRGGRGSIARCSALNPPAMLETFHLGRGGQMPSSGARDKKRPMQTPRSQGWPSVSSPTASASDKNTEQKLHQPQSPGAGCTTAELGGCWWNVEVVGRRDRRPTARAGLGRPGIAPNQAEAPEGRPGITAKRPPEARERRAAGPASLALADADLRIRQPLRPLSFMLPPERQAGRPPRCPGVRMGPKRATHPTAVARCHRRARGRVEGRSIGCRPG